MQNIYYMNVLQYKMCILIDKEKGTTYLGIETFLLKDIKYRLNGYSVSICKLQSL